MSFIQDYYGIKIGRDEPLTRHHETELSEATPAQIRQRAKEQLARLDKLIKDLKEQLSEATAERVEWARIVKGR